MCYHVLSGSVFVVVVVVTGPQLYARVPSSIYGEMNSHQSCKSYVFYVSETPSHDFCCAYLERHNKIFL